MMRTLVPLLAGLFACGGSANPRTRASFQISVADGYQFAVTADQTTTIVFSVFGAQGSVTFTASGLPRFAVLSGDRVVIAPARTDAGSYDFSMTASDGHSEDTKHFQLSVSVDSNHAPDWAEVFSPWLAAGGNPPNEIRRGPPVDCTSSAVLHADVTDADGDSTRLELEIVAAGSGFSRQATTTTPWFVARLELDVFSLLPLGQAVDVQARVVDTFGKTSTWRVVVLGITCH